MPILPPLLTPGGKIALLSPSFKVDETVAQMAYALWKAEGFSPVFSLNSLKASDNYSGNDDQRRQDFQAALDDPEVQVIHCLRGGYGLTRYLDRIDFSKFKQSPKWLVGFSDITAMLLALDNQGIACIHGPMASHIQDDKVRESLIDLLTKGTLSVDWKDYSEEDEVVVEGQATGGTLTLLCHSLGSPYELDSQNKILFIEEVGEQLYHIDRMMLQLQRAGKLEGLRALLAGHFTEVKDTATPFGKTVKEIILDHAAGYGYPILLDRKSVV